MPPRRYEIPSTDGTPIPVWQSGNGRPLLIVHGATTDHRSWDAVREHLEPHVTVAALNRRNIVGDPLSHYDLAIEFEDVAAVAKALGGEVDVFGHSSGALCALGAALLTPNLRRLVLYEPPLAKGPHYPAALGRLDELLRAGDIDGVFDAWLKDYAGMPEGVAEELKASPIGAEIRPFAQYLPREMAAQLAWTFDQQAFAGLPAPTLFLTGAETPEEDEALRGYIGLLKGVIPNFTVREIPGQGHMANFLAPALLAEIILDFLQSDV